MDGAEHVDEQAERIAELEDEVKRLRCALVGIRALLDTFQPEGDSR